MKKHWRLIILLPLILGFRIYPGGNAWRVNGGDPKLFLRFCDQIVPYINDVDGPDSLAGQTLTQNIMINSITQDYNSVPGSYLLLKDSAQDSEFNATKFSNRIIDICYSTQQDFIEGHTSPVYDNDGFHYKGCQIQIGKKILTSAKLTLRTIEHEIGHCLGFDHPQDTHNAIMSYFSDAYRLQADDKAGLVFMYPINPDDAQETPSWGLSCASR